MEDGLRQLDKKIAHEEAPYFDLALKLFNLPSFWLIQQTTYWCYFKKNILI